MIKDCLSPNRIHPQPEARRASALKSAREEWPTNPPGYIRSSALGASGQ